MIKNVVESVQKEEITLDKIDLNKKIYIWVDEELYKLHRVERETYAWISLKDSICWANGTFKSDEKAVKSALHYGTGVYELDNIKDLAEIW